MNMKLCLELKYSKLKSQMSEVLDVKDSAQAFGVKQSS